MPDEELQDDGQEEIRVEVEPDPDEEKPRLNGRDTRSLDVSDDEISGYGKSVQKRIKGLRFAYHEERRLREQSQHDQRTAAELAQRLFRENAELKKNQRASEQALIQQAVLRADGDIEQAKAKSRKAYEDGHSEEIVASNAELARAVAEKERLSLLSAAPEPAERTEERQPANQAPPPDEATQRWMSRNSWYGKPGNEERTALALGVHNRLVAQGINPATQADLYWRTIDERLNAVFPEQANGNGNGNRAAHENGTSTNSRPLAVAGGTRSNTGATNTGRARVIQLSSSQVRLARRLGLTPEQYAAQVALESEAASA